MFSVIFFLRLFLVSSMGFSVPSEALYIIGGKMNLDEADLQRIFAKSIWQIIDELVDFLIL